MVKLLSFLGLATMSAVPVLAGLGIGWLHNEDVARVAEGEDVRSVAQSIAAREFGGNVTLDVLDQSSTQNVTDEYGDVIRADPGREFRHVDIEVSNHGRLDIGVHTYHFSVYDDAHRRSKAVLGISDVFEVTQVPGGGAANGTVVFDMAKGATLARVFWQGELYNATLELG